MLSITAEFQNNQKKYHKYPHRLLMQRSQCIHSTVPRKYQNTILSVVEKKKSFKIHMSQTTTATTDFKLIEAHCTISKYVK